MKAAVSASRPITCSVCLAFPPRLLAASRKRVFSTRPQKCAAATQLYKISSSVSTENREPPSRHSQKASRTFSRNSRNAKRGNFFLRHVSVSHQTLAASRLPARKLAFQSTRFRDAKRSNFKNRSAGKTTKIIKEISFAVANTKNRTRGLTRARRAPLKRKRRQRLASNNLLCALQLTKTMLEKDNSFLQQTRDLLSGVESGEYEMHDAQLRATVADVSTANDKFRRCEQTGHIFITMLIYKRPGKNSGDYATSPETSN